MNWREYFEKAEGTGLLATSSRAGDVNIAVYSKPKVMQDGTLAFGMTDRLTHANLEENPRAAYAFLEQAFRGRRLYLEKVREMTRGPVLKDSRDRANAIDGPGTGEQIEFLVLFRILKHLPLVGAQEPEPEAFPGVL